MVITIITTTRTTVLDIMFYLELIMFSLQLPKFHNQDSDHKLYHKRLKKGQKLQSNFLQVSINTKLEIMMQMEISLSLTKAWHNIKDQYSHLQLTWAQSHLEMFSNGSILSQLKWITIYKIYIRRLLQKIQDIRRLLLNKRRGLQDIQSINNLSKAWHQNQQYYHHQ